MAQYESKLKKIYFLFLNLFFLVPWGEVEKSLVKEIVTFIKQVMSFDNDGKPKKAPCSSVILKRPNGECCQNLVSNTVIYMILQG